MEHFMLKLKKLFGMLWVLVLILGLTACGTKLDNNTDNTPTPTVTQDENESSNAGATEDGANSQVTDSNDQSATDETAADGVSYPITITDSYGKEITFEQEPMKIISLGPNITEMIYDLGAGEKLVGRTDDSDYPEQVLEVQSVGTIFAPNIEGIISLDPDLVIISTHFDQDSQEQIENLGIPVMALFEEKDFTGVYKMINLLGTTINKKAEAANLVEEMTKQVEEITASVQGLEKPTVYYVVSSGQYGDYTAGGDTFIGYMLELAGGDNIAKDISGWSYNLESLVEADPEIIVIGNAYKDEFIHSQGYSELTAVLEERVYGIDNNLLDRQGYRNVEGLRELVNIFHPEINE